MHAMMPLLRHTEFPALRRRKPRTLQVNLGYTCNQSCLHCHVNAGPSRKEQMSGETVDVILRFLAGSQDIDTVDVTGGAPEMNPHFRRLVRDARELGRRVIDRCNLTILEHAGYEDLAAFLAEQRVDVIASLPCYLESNVDSQRGSGTYGASIRALQRLNALGYGRAAGELKLDLVYNPLGPQLPPAQCALEQDYKRELKARYGIEFNRLYTLANMPIARFGSTLVSKGEFEPYMRLLRSAHKPENLSGVMCRELISIDYQGYVYDCDFNQMLNLPLRVDSRPRMHLSDLSVAMLEGNPVEIADHCYGCTAGQGSSCGGALS